jgi:phosphonoacetaldehyde hydrolase
MQYQHPGAIECVIFDWAGTVVDFGSFAPTRIFVEAFAEFGVAITLEEARGPMGMGKWDHIRALCNNPDIAARYAREFGHAPTDDDVTEIYKRFLPLQIAKVGDYSAMIPGALETIAFLRGRGVKIGSSSGYPKVVMERVVALSAQNGFTADCVVATDEVPCGRPWPSQSLANAVALGVSDVAACVKIDDTAPGILEGRRSGMWTVALLMSGNALGLSHEQYLALPETRKDSERARIRALFAPTEPHYMVDTIADLPKVIEDIDRRLAAGEFPQTAPRSDL